LFIVQQFLECFSPFRTAGPEDRSQAVIERL